MGHDLVGVTDCDSREVDIPDRMVGTLDRQNCRGVAPAVVQRHDETDGKAHAAKTQDEPAGPKPKGIF